MIFAVFLIILLFACLSVILNWRNTLLAIMAVGFLQDPFRKLVVGEPAVFVVMVGCVFLVAFMVLVSRIGVAGITEPYTKWTHELLIPLALFAVILGAQYLHSLFRYGNPIVSTVGLASYVSPFLAMAVGYFAVRSVADIRRFMQVYAVVGVLIAVTVMLSFVGFEWSIFKEVGAGLKIYDQGTVLKSHAGLMRTGEIAAWHIATATCFVMILNFSGEQKSSSFIVSLLAIALMIAVFLTGRRKMFMLFSLFIVFYIFGYSYFRRSIDVRYIMLGVTLAVLIWFTIEFFYPGGYGDSINNYVARGSSVYADATGRFVELGINPAFWAYNRVGLFGGGLGIASQGTQFFGSINVAGGSGEGGVGKIIVELGVPGLLIVLLLGVSFFRYLLRLLSLCSRVHLTERYLSLSVGIAVLLLVNLATFTVATQLYGDIYILLLLGILTGFLLALPRIISDSLTEQGLA